MRVLVWLFRAFIFFSLFAFALNNLQTTTVNWFFGVRWNAPLVIVVLVAFVGGCALGVLAMVPAWWNRRRQALRATPEPVATRSEPVSPPTPSAAMSPSEFGAMPPPREGL